MSFVPSKATPQPAAQVASTSPPDTSAASERFYGLDGVRAAAMLLGVFYHLPIAFLGAAAGGGFGASPKSFVDNWLHSFRMPLFFLISGFFANMMLGKYGVKKYLARRWWRIGAPLIVFLFGYAGAQIAIQKYGPPQAAGFGFPGAPPMGFGPPAGQGAGQNPFGQPGGFGPPGGGQNAGGFGPPPGGGFGPPGGGQMPGGFGPPGGGAFGPPGGGFGPPPGAAPGGQRGGGQNQNPMGPPGAFGPPPGGAFGPGPAGQRPAGGVAPPGGFSPPPEREQSSGSGPPPLDGMFSVQDSAAGPVSDDSVPDPAIGETQAAESSDASLPEQSNVTETEPAKPESPPVSAEDVPPFDESTTADVDAGESSPVDEGGFGPYAGTAPAGPPAGAGPFGFGPPQFGPPGQGGPGGPAGPPPFQMPFEFPQPPSREWADGLFREYSRYFNLGHLWFLWYLLVFSTAAPLVAACCGVVCTGSVQQTFDRVGRGMLRWNLAGLVLGVVSLPALIHGKNFMGWSLANPLGFSAAFPDCVIQYFNDWPFYLLYFFSGWFLYRVRSGLDCLARNWLWNLTLGVVAFAVSQELAERYATAQGVAHIDWIRRGGFALYSLGSAFSACGFLGLFQRYLNRPSRVGRYFADTALWIYLIHLPLIPYVIQWTEPSRSAWWVATIGGMAVVTGVSLVTFELFIRRTPLNYIFGPANARRSQSEQQRQYDANSAPKEAHA